MSRLLREWARRVTLGLLSLLIVGCGVEKSSGPELILVSGTVKIGATPLTSGTVLYRDSLGLVQATSEISADGTYSLSFNRRKGAPAGEYLVLVFASEQTSGGDTHRSLPQLVIDRKFTQPGSTPLKMEVKPGMPDGYYDLTVSK